MWSVRQVSSGSPHSWPFRASPQAAELLPFITSVVQLITGLLFNCVNVSRSYGTDVSKLCPTKCIPSSPNPNWCFSGVSYIVLTCFKYAASAWFGASFLVYCYLVLLLPLIKFVHVVQTKFKKVSDHVKEKKS